ncbi:hypothetical protein L3X38_015334 [Prunus dulcis]|uniref:Aminotransferase-like plant mobile domain-containing protein n=1 Tax=Prunus dulcis TaxID=3755 RepID=A0AAD4ZIU4_PRUDU|nr:hypothetical protein L3X38_015334 [Prunus dulcis]
MSSPRSRAQSSSASIPPDYITGSGIDAHAIEVRSKLHPFAQKNLDENVLHLFENTLVLGPHWFGPVPAEAAELLEKAAEAPLCFESNSALASHSWVSKNLSRSFPSSEVRNSPVKWADWIDRLLPRYGGHWRRAGIYDAILLSKQSINRDENLLAAALCFWNSASNTFDFRVGPMAPTLLDMAQIFGFRPHGRPIDAVGSGHRESCQLLLFWKFCDDLLRSCGFDWLGLYPFGEIVCSNNDKTVMLAAGWIDFANEIHCPSPKRPWFYHWIHRDRRSLLDWAVPLTGLTSLGIVDAILQHGWPEVAIPSN